MGNLCCIPGNARRELDALHENKLQTIYDNIDNEIYMLSHYMSQKSTSVQFPSKCKYKTANGVWSCIYDYTHLDYMIHTIKIGYKQTVYYKERYYDLEFNEICELDNDIVSEYPQCQIRITVY
jgi:hypothetical protein